MNKEHKQYEDYPEYHTSPLVHNVVERCRTLQENVFSKKGVPYKFASIQSNCSKRKIKNFPIRTRKTAIVNIQLDERGLPKPKEYNEGDKYHSKVNGKDYQIFLNVKGKRYWKRIA